MSIKKIILDCDPGMDDSMAIIMAVKSDKLDLKAITAVNGNYPVEVTSVNALKTLEMLNKTHIPVARGLQEPLVRESPADPFTHGRDGQGENFLPNPQKPLSETHAVDLIIEKVKENSGDIYIVATGPLSNIAMALKKAPEIRRMISGIYTISGAFGLNKYSYLNATGDSPQSEWNVFVDPEAADIVYNSGIHLVAIGLDVAAHSDIDFSSHDIDLFNRSDKKEAHFLSQSINFVRGRGYDSYCAVIDCMAVAYAIDPNIIETIKGKVGIETTGSLTLGNTVLDRRLHHRLNTLTEISIASKADFSSFLALVKKLVLC